MECAKQERAQLALLAVGAAERVVGEQVGKEALDEVLRVGGRVAAPAHKRVERRPVRLAKVAERVLRGHGRLTLHRLYDQTPVRGVKRRAACLQSAWVVSHD